jgi:sulfate adenylyltransferase subunit 1 (EFTu-like GTPase family)
VKRIVTWDGDLEMAHAPMSVTLTLEDEIDISRGDVLVSDAGPRAKGVGLHEPSALSAQPFVEKRFEAEMVWMDERPLDPHRVYLMKQGTRIVSAEVNHGLVLNQIGAVTITASRPLVFDRYGDNRTTGSFILIDPATNFTAGAGMITAAVHDRATSSAKPTAAERLARLARAAATDADAVDAVRKALEEILK